MEVELHVFSVSALVGEQRSFNIPVTVLGQRNIVPIFGGRGGCGVIAAIGTVRGKLLVAVCRQGEACSAANVILKIGHGLLQTG